MRRFTTDMGKLAGITELNHRFEWFFGEEEPSPTYPFLIWAKQSANAIYMRKTTNDAWIKIANLSGVAEQIKSHTHTKSEITNFSHTHTRNEITDFSHTHSNATTSAAGFMSASDKTKLNAITIEKITVGSYSGNGSTSWRNISVGFSPNMVIVGTPSPGTSHIWFATSSGTAHTNIEVTSTGFRVRAEGSTTLAPNRSGDTFRYCAIR